MRSFLLEDNPNDVSNFMSSMTGSHVQFRHFSKASELFHAMTVDRPQMMVLDWSLPDVCGLQVLKRTRELLGNEVPVVMLSNMSNDHSVVEALDAGADDYLFKPLTGPVLRARIEAMVRRTLPAASAPKIVTLGGLTLDYGRQTATADGEPVVLTPKEFDVAWVVSNNPNRFISKAELIASVWGRSVDVAAHTVAQHIHAVRKKLRLSELDLRLVAVYGTGYRLEFSAPVSPPEPQPIPLNAESLDYSV
ncbi:MAG: response regulator transcription factor [Rhizobacter sp.]